MSPWLIGGIILLFVGFFVFAIQRVVKAHRTQSITGWEELIGKPATVKLALRPEGQVLFRGERWRAVSEEGPVKPGEEVIIDKVENLTLYVKKYNRKV